MDLAIWQLEPMAEFDGNGQGQLADSNGDHKPVPTVDVRDGIWLFQLCDAVMQPFADLQRRDRS
jgi:hypothetical protein